MMFREVAAANEYMASKCSKNGAFKTIADVINDIVDFCLHMDGKGV